MLFIFCAFFVCVCLLFPVNSKLGIIDYFQQGICSIFYKQHLQHFWGAAYEHQLGEPFPPFLDYLAWIVSFGQ